MGGSRFEAREGAGPAPSLAVDRGPVIEQLLRALLANTRDAVAVVRVDVDPPIVVASSAANVRLLGRNAVGRPLGADDPPHVQEFLVHTFRRAAEQGSLAANGAWTTREGREVHIGSTFEAFDVGDERYVLATSHDASEPVGMGGDPVVLETLLASAALDRRRVAQDLHDDTVQVLSAVTVELELLRRRGGEHADWLGRLRDHLQSANERIRDMVADLDPGASVRTALGAALQERLQRPAQQAGVQLTVVDRLTEPLPEAVAGALYLIATEAVFNALRHARAERVEVELVASDGSVQLHVRDCGKGFDPTVPPRPGHYGLVSMRARAQQLGGSLAVTSSAQRGTKISARLPLDDDRDREATDGSGGATAVSPAHMDQMVNAIRRVDADLQVAWRASRIGMLLCDAAGVVTRANPAAGVRLGVDHQDLIGTALLGALRGGETGNSGLRTALLAVRTGTAEHRRGTALIIGDDGSRWLVRYHVQALTGSDGPPWPMMVTVDEP